MQDSDGFKLDALIRETLEKSSEPDLHVIAKRLVSKIPADQRDLVLASCLYDRVRVVNTHVRMGAGRDDAAVSSRSRGRSKWARLSPMLRVRYPVVGKVLADCTPEDVDVIAGDYAVRAAANADAAEWFRSLGERMRAAGVATVADLGDVELGVAA